MWTMPNDEFAPENIRPRAYIEYKSAVSLTELIGLMTSFCNHADELTSNERSAALFIIQQGIKSHQ